MEQAQDHGSLAGFGVTVLNLVVPLQTENRIIPVSQVERIVK
jgi:hypothetical protein